MRRAHERNTFEHMKRRATDPTLAVLYLRVSTTDQNLGPDAQLATVERWACANGVRILATHGDHGVSGGASLDRRPGLLAALDALKEHGAGLLVVAKRDRLARDPIVAAMVEAAAARVGARIVSAAGEGDGDDPAAILMRRMVDAFAEYERHMIRARTKAALAVKRSRGERVSGRRPSATASTRTAAGSCCARTSSTPSSMSANSTPPG
ncbi:MAG: recombinase family protein [Sandaracinaceae bacterium]|nr:recombinase family protein [Sandaracinaceae bacterium]